jgi:excisionase family DNA binding protein
VPTKSKPKIAPAAPPLENYLTRNAAAALLSVTAQSIDKHIKSGALPVYRLGRTVLIKPSDLRRLVEGE